MTIFSLLPTFQRFMHTALNVRNISTCINPLCFRLSNTLFGEPLKRKKRLDPAIIRQREERRKRKLEKQIRRLEKHAKQLKPISEMEVSFKLIDQREERSRSLYPLLEKEVESRIILQKKWAKYKNRQYLADIQVLDSILYSQQKALDELRIESEELYQEAIQTDLAFLPCITEGPVKTPPIENYESPDGEYINITRKFDGEE